METKQQPKQTTLGDVQGTLSALRAELGDLPSRMQAAAKAGHAEALIDLQDRFDRLPRLIRAKEVQLAGLRVEELEAQLPEAEVAFSEAAKLNEDARAKLQQAQIVQQATASEFYARNERLLSVRGELTRAKLHLADLVAQEGRLQPAVIRNTGWTKQD